MTRLIARLILAMLILPTSCALFVSGMFVCSKFGPDPLPPIVVWAIVYTFIAVYWILLWRELVTWTNRRKTHTLFAGMGALVLGVVVGIAAQAILSGPPIPAILIGGGVVPITWVIATVFIWRETAQERIVRITAAGTDAVVCPNCGYNMTGLREARCPECGSAFTVDQLVTGQPHRDRGILSDVDTQS